MTAKVIAMDTRRLKVVKKYEPRIGYYKPFPWINISGKWVEKAGFDIGDNIQVSVGKSFLMIWKEPQ